MPHDADEIRGLFHRVEELSVEHLLCVGGVRYRGEHHIGLTSEGVHLTREAHVVDESRSGVAAFPSRNHTHTQGVSESTHFRTDTPEPDH